MFDAAALPGLPGAVDLAEAGVETGGAAHNRRFVAPALDLGDVPPALVVVAHDPQTSGGLLVAAPRSKVDRVRSELADQGVESWLIGEVEAVAAGVEPGVRLQ